jgi:hypothetical protein
MLGFLLLFLYKAGYSDMGIRILYSSSLTGPQVKRIHTGLIIQTKKFCSSSRAGQTVRGIVIRSGRSFHSCNCYSVRVIFQFMKLLFGHGDHSIQGIFIHPSLVIHFNEIFINPGHVIHFHEAPIHLGKVIQIWEVIYSISWVGHLLLGSLIPPVVGL